MTTTSAAARNSSERTVMRPESPGPAPTKATRPGTRLRRAEEPALELLVELLVEVVVVVVVERVGLTVHAPCCRDRVCGRCCCRGRRAEWVRSPRLGLGSCCRVPLRGARDAGRAPRRRP